MANIILLVHLILAVSLIGVVLLQRSDGGALGIGGGGGLSTGRPPASPLQKITWTLAAAFIATSLGLTTIASRSVDGGSVIDGAIPVETPAPADPLGGALLPPTLNEGAPLTPPAEGPLTPPTDGPLTPPAAPLPAQ